MKMYPRILAVELEVRDADQFDPINEQVCNGHHWIDDPRTKAIHT
jgi:hypothetical protein